MTSRCKRCIIDYIHGYPHPECYTCKLKQSKIKVCVVCFKGINNTSQLCSSCEYTPTFEITRYKKLKS